VLLEASGCNTPWIATRVGGIPEIEHLGVNRLVPAECPADLAEAIAGILKSEPRTGGRPRAPEEGVAETAAFLNQLHFESADGRRGSH
jgi:glycosyltransferase involved in cell wall biosynthesis